MGEPLVEIEGRWQVRLNREIGSGGFGAVFRAKDNHGTPPCDSAAKRVSVVEKADREAYISELEVLKKVHDISSVIGLQGSAEIGDHGWMFLEMATGGELFDRLIDSHSLSERAAWPYVSALVGAVKECHARGVVHRDIKLENVMLCAEDAHAVRLIDFGLAVQLKLNEDGTVAPDQLLTDSAGTQAYRAPEVTTAGYDPTKVDVWAIGIVLFSLVAGFFPIQEARVEDWRFKRIAQEQSKGVSACDAVFRMYKRQCPFSAPLRDLIDGMLRIDSSKRLSIEEVATHAWVRAPPLPVIVDDAARSEKPQYRGLSAFAGTNGDDGYAGSPPEDAIRICRQKAKRGSTL